MCKESMQASSCPKCGQRMYYVEQHLPHCFAKPTPIQRPRRKRKKEAHNVA